MYRSNKIFTLYILVIIVSLNACSSTMSYRYYPSNFTLGASTVEIKTNNFCDMIFVQASINENEPQWFILDTGSNQLMLDDRDFPKGQIEFSGLSTPMRLIGMVQNFKPTRPIASISLGAARFENISGIVFGSSIIFDEVELHSKLNIAGIIGNNLFNNLTISLNYHDQILTISEDGLGAVNGEDILVMQLRDNIPWVESTIAGQSIVAMLDSAYPGPPMFSYESAQKLEMNMSQVTIPSLHIFGETEATIGSSLNDDIHLGQYIYKNPTVLTQSEDSWWDDDMVIYGGTLLKHFTTSLDFKNKRIQLSSQSGGLEFSDPDDWLEKSAACLDGSSDSSLQ